MTEQLNTSSGPLALSLADFPEIVERLNRRQQFTCYEHAGKPYRGWMVAIGPIGDHLPLSAFNEHRAANLIVDALRHAAGQDPLLSRAFDTDEDSDND